MLIPNSVSKVSHLRNTSSRVLLWLLLFFGVLLINSSPNLEMQNNEVTSQNPNEPSISFSETPLSNISGRGGHAEGGMIVLGDLLLTCGYRNLLSLYNVSQPTHPILQGQLLFDGWCFDLVQDGDMVIISTQPACLWVINISIISPPCVVQQFIPSDLILDLELGIGGLFGAGQDQGLVRYILNASMGIIEEHRYSFASKEEGDVQGYTNVFLDHMMVGALTPTGFLHLFSVSSNNCYFYAEINLVSEITAWMITNQSMFLLTSKSILKITLSSFHMIIPENISATTIPLILSSFDLSPTVVSYSLPSEVIYPDRCITMFDSATLGIIKNNILISLNLSTHMFSFSSPLSFGALSGGFCHIFTLEDARNLLYLANYEGRIFVVENNVRENNASESEDIIDEASISPSDFPAETNDSQIVLNEPPTPSSTGGRLWVFLSIGIVGIVSGSASVLVKIRSKRRVIADTKEEILIPLEPADLSLTPRDVFMGQIHAKKEAICSSLDLDSLDIVTQLQTLTENYRTRLDLLVESPS